MQAPTRQTRPGHYAAAVAAWATLVLAGCGAMFAYSIRPGVASAATVAPGDPAIAAASDRPSLVVFLHPFCPCSRATLANVAEIAKQVPGAPMTAVFVEWDDEPRDSSFEQSELWKRAGAIAGLRRVHDRDGSVARKFGAQTSGQAFVVDASGALRFSGGLTVARGELGDNAGLRGALAALSSGTKSATTPVYGCPLE